jgi:hypothetical protein
MHTHDRPHTESPDVPLKKSALSRCQRQLVELMQDIRFGRIQHLHIAGGKPDLSQPFLVYRTVKIRGRTGPHPAASNGDCLLKAEVIDLLAQIRRIGDGLIETIEIRDGLPFKLDICESVTVGKTLPISKPHFGIR